MEDIGKEQSINLVINFVRDVLGNNIEGLKEFSFLNLNFINREKYIEDEYKDKISPEQAKIYGDYLKVTYQNGKIKYYNHGSCEDYDNMNLTRAIYYLLFCDKLPSLTWEDLMWEVPHGRIKTITNNYRGETINTFNTLINEDCYKEFFKDISNSDKFLEDIKVFLYKVFSIGNFILLPNSSIGSKTLNTYKGLCLNDYSDRFFNHIISKDNNYINKLLSKNSFWYEEFKEPINLNKFIIDNYLQDYFKDNNELNYGFSPYYAYWNYSKSQNIEEKEIYAGYIKKYMEVVTDKINKRAGRMINDLKEIIKKESKYIK